MAPFRQLATRLLIIVNILVAAFFLLACLAPYLDTSKWWIMSILALGFPFLLLIVFLFFFFWLFIKFRYILISLVTLLIGWKNIARLLTFHPQTTFNYSKKRDVLRIVTWNVARFIELKRNANEGSQIRAKMMDLIRQQNADVLCLQEFHTSINPAYYNNIEHIQKVLDYPYF